MDAWRRAEKADSADILLLRFDKGAVVPRVLFPDRGPFEDTRYFDIFGPTILGTNRSVDTTLESRSIQIVMPESSRLFDNCVTPEKAMPLRQKLLAYRAQYLGRPLPEVEKPYMGRFGDLVRPMCQIVQEVAPDRRSTLMRLLEHLENERRASKSESLEASVLEAIETLAGEAVNSQLAVKRVTERVNVDRPERLKLTPQKIGRIIKALGLCTKRSGTNGASALVWDEDKLRKLLPKYGLKGTSVSSGTSVLDELGADPTELSEHSEAIDLPF